MERQQRLSGKSGTRDNQEARQSSCSILQVAPSLPFASPASTKFPNCSDRLTAYDSVSVGCFQPEFSETPGFVSWMGRNDRSLGRKLLTELIHALNVPVREIG